jgi:hypothetical protein
MDSFEPPRIESFKIPYRDVIYFHDYFQDKRERPNPHHIVTWRWSTPEEEEIAWPMCAVSGCLNKSCRRLNSKYCHPHTMLMELKPYWESE